MHTTRTKWGAAATAMVATLALGVAAPASSQLAVSEPLAEGLFGPLGLAVDDDGTIYVTQTFGAPSALTVIEADGTTTNVAEAAAETNGFGGVSARDGEIVFTISGDGVGLLERLLSPGSTETIASPAQWEADENPDQVNSYGFQGLDPACVAEVGAIPDIPGGGEPYPGEVDSNPYGVASLPDGSWIVADAGGNDLVGVQPDGTMSTIAVLPPLPFVVPDGAPLPECTWGTTFNFEPVPTDVELGPDGQLYVTGLPGGPEDASFGARGVVFRVDPDTGEAAVVASGFLGATGLAIADDGSIYVAELFGNKVSKVVGGGPETVAEVDAPAAIESFDGKLYVTIRALPGEDGPPNGAVVTIDLPAQAATTTTTTAATPSDGCPGGGGQAGVHRLGDVAGRGPAGVGRRPDRWRRLAGGQLPALHREPLGDETGEPAADAHRHCPDDRLRPVDPAIGGVRRPHVGHPHVPGPQRGQRSLGEHGRQQPGPGGDHLPREALRVRLRGLLRQCHGRSLAPSVRPSRDTGRAGLSPSARFLGDDRPDG